MSKTVSPWLREEPKNIIIRMPNWLGDLVMATPTLKDIRNRWKNTKITVMCQSNVAPLLEHDPNIDEILSFKRPSRWIHHSEHWEIIEPLRKGEYDLGVLLTNSFSSAWWFWRGHVQNRIGFKGNWRSQLLNRAIPYPENTETQHLVLTYKMLLVPLGIPISETTTELYVSDEEMEDAKSLLQRYGAEVGKHTIIGINPGAAYGSAKCWLPERFEAVTRRLLEDPDTYVVYFGDPAGAPLVHDICKEMPDRVIDLAGRTSIRELMALLKCCTSFLTNDSGPMHIASALNVPLLALFGSTNDVKTGPYGGGHVIHKHVECSPCYKRVCPIDFRCMKRIEVDEVYQKLHEITQEGKRKG